MKHHHASYLQLVVCMIFIWFATCVHVSIFSVATAVVVSVVCITTYIARVLGILKHSIITQYERMEELIGRPITLHTIKTEYIGSGTFVRRRGTNRYIYTDTECKVIEFSITDVVGICDNEIYITRASSVPLDGAYE